MTHTGGGLMIVDATQRTTPLATTELRLACDESENRRLSTRHLILIIHLPTSIILGLPPATSPATCSIVVTGGRAGERNLSLFCKKIAAKQTTRNERIPSSELWTNNSLLKTCKPAYPRFHCAPVHEHVLEKELLQAVAQNFEYVLQKVR